MINKTTTAAIEIPMIASVRICVFRKKEKKTIDVKENNNKKDLLK
jgi:hypothetical protein